MKLQDAKDAVRAGVGEPNPDYVDAPMVCHVITREGVQTIRPNPNPYLAWAESLNQRLCNYYAITRYGSIPAGDWVLPIFYAR